jgi:hypothetical protein
MEILDSKYLRPEGMKSGSEYCLTSDNVWQILTENGLEKANQEEADYNQLILETTLEDNDHVLAEVSISEVRFTQDKETRGIINFVKEKDRFQVRI